MQRTWKMSTLFSLVAVLAGAIVLSSNSTVEARPKYRTVFQKNYEKVAANNTITCFACHGKLADGKMDKEKRNAYAQALGKAIGKKNETNEASIVAAMKKIEKEKSAVEGKTYGDLLEAGQLPVKIEE
jgi:hypothetical protein